MFGVDTFRIKAHFLWKSFTDYCCLQESLLSLYSRAWSLPVFRALY